MNKKVLILGGGVAVVDGLLPRKKDEVTLVEKNSRVGGLARTCYYSGHPYEFGPHIWFWPGGKDDPVNHTIVKLTNDELFHIDQRSSPASRPTGRSIVTRCTTRTSTDAGARPDPPRAGQNRDSAMKLIQEQLPEIGNCKFADYFTEAIGQTLPRT